MTNTQLVADILQNISVRNVNKAFVYITDWTSPLTLYLCKLNVLNFIAIKLRNSYLIKQMSIGRYQQYNIWKI